ncbi:MAG: hypothetical protein C0603_00660 [Denitrovibrio sp.]|nr:MAG: hypothetical protein C0603_00660 [Denitrovibrio sp.]
MKLWRTFLATAIVASALILAGCGGGGGGSSSTTTTTTSDSIDTTEAEAADATTIVTAGSTGRDALAVASRVSVVDTTQGASSITDFNFARALMRAIDTGTFAAVADYNIDQTDVWVNDRAVEAFGTPNEILCMIEQTRYGLMVNRGAYVAQINSELCEARAAGSGGEQEGEGQSSVDVPDYEYWVLNAVRGDEADSPQVIEAWIPNEEDDGQSGFIFARIVVTKDKTEVPPFGVFTMNFKMLPFDSTGNQANMTADYVFRGLMKSFENTAGENLLAFTDVGEFTEEIQGQQFDISFNEKVIMAKNSTGGRGAASITDFDFGATGPEQVTKVFNLSYNQNYFMRQNVGADARCFDRANPDVNAWRYGVYDSNGDRVEISSGLPVGYTDSDGEIVEGWAGYWGLWMNNGDGNFDPASLSNTTLYRFDWADYGLDQTEAYTLNVYPGKLRKIVREEVTLSKIEDIPLNYWEESTGDEYRVEWNGTALEVTAKRDANYYWDEDAAEVGSVVDLSALRYPDLYFWSEALNGSVRIQMGDTCTGTNLNDNDWNNDSFDCSSAMNGTTTKVTFYAETEIQPGVLNSNINLICYENCPEPGNEYNYQTWDQRHDYVFDTATMTLYENSVAPANSVAFPSNGVGWGISTGPLVASGDFDATDIQCEWDATQTCGWQLESKADTFYRWESGKESWNKMMALEYASGPNSGDVVAFDQPIDIKYEHAANGKTYMLKYEGFGNLWGIPEICYEGETGTEITCPWLEEGWSGEYGGEWLQIRNEIAIPAGANATYKNSSGTTVEVVIKPLEEEHYLNKVDAANCTADGLSIVDYTTQFVDLENCVDPTSTGMMGQVPSITDLLNGGDPAIIDGELAPGFTLN